MNPSSLPLEALDREAKVQFARYDYAVELLSAMSRFVYDLQAHGGEQMKRHTMFNTTKWPFDFPTIAETLLLGVTLDNHEMVHGKLRSHISAAVLVRSQLEAIAYKRDFGSQLARLPEELSTGKPGDVYAKIKLLKGLIGADQVTYLSKTYNALNFAVHHALNFSYGEAWIFVETVKRAGVQIETKLREQGAFRTEDNLAPP